MLKVFIKHVIYEKCIDILFQKIRLNFAIPDVLKAGDIKEGDFFSKISYILNGKRINFINVTMGKGPTENTLAFYWDKMIYDDGSKVGNLPKERFPAFEKFTYIK